MESSAPAGVFAVKGTVICVPTPNVPLAGFMEIDVMVGGVPTVADGGAQCSDADDVRVVPAV